MPNNNNNYRSFQNKKANGRVDILPCSHPDIADQFQMYDKIPVNQCTTFRNPTEGIWDRTQLSDLFFSEKNICTIQNGIRMGVYEKSNGHFIISNQDEDTLKIIMRSIFLQSSVNLSHHIREQVNDLNNLVLKYCVHQVYNEAKGYKKYLVDASTMYNPISPPILTSNNDKQLPLHNWF